MGRTCLPHDAGNTVVILRVSSSLKSNFEQRVFRHPLDYTDRIGELAACMMYSQVPEWLGMTAFYGNCGRENARWDLTEKCVGRTVQDRKSTRLNSSHRCI